MRPLSLSLALLMLLALPGLVVADDAENAKLEELWKTGSLWQVGDNIPKVEAARKAIVAEGDVGLAFIFTKLSSTDGLEYRCIEAVFKGFGAKALPGLYEHMVHEDVKVRRNVAAMLGVIDDKSAGTKMVEHLKKETDLRCRVGHLQTLARWKEPTALDPLIECTKTTQEKEPLAERLKVRIVPLLANFEDEKAIYQLGKLLDDPAYFIRDAAREALLTGKLDVRYWTWFGVPLARNRERAIEEDLLSIRRRVPTIEAFYRKGDIEGFVSWIKGLLASTDAGIRGNCALFMAGKGFEIWSKLQLNPDTDIAWKPVADLDAALANESDPYALACIEKALRKFGVALEK